MSKKMIWRKFHKWGGLLTAGFILIFCLSGIVLNHRELFSNCNVSRKLLPKSYHLNQFNDGIIKGTTVLSGDSILAYGNAGIWLTNSRFENFEDFNNGFPSGVDRRNIKNIVKTPDGSLWSAAQFGIYRCNGNHWEELEILGNDERISDIAISPDSTSLIVLTRSKIYTLNPQTGKSVGHVVPAPSGKNSEVTLFKTFWMLHSGELFGLTGRIIVDIVAVIIIFLCITGIIIVFIPYKLKWNHLHRQQKPSSKTLHFFRLNYKLHDKVGYITAILTIIIAFTGMCLRPPLMIPLVMTKTAPLPESSLDSYNYWHDKMRGIRWNDEAGKWLLSTSDGFIHVNADFSSLPVLIDNGNIPPVSPMGITVFEKFGSGEWLIGSFSGIFLWNLNNGTTKDFITGNEYNAEDRSYGTSTSLISGFSRDLDIDETIIIDYSTGNQSLPEMSDELRSQPMSLWRAALELHVGRCYTSFMGPFSQLFVFVFGLLLTLILVSGVIIHLSCKKKNKLNKNNN